MKRYIYFLAALATIVSLCGGVTQSSAATKQQSVIGSIKDNTGAVVTGATVVWAGTNVATTSDTEGRFKLHRVKDNEKLVAYMLGYRIDTIAVANGAERLDIKLQSLRDLESVEVHSKLNANFISLDGIAKNEVISFAGLCKMACCNLAESFENSASVTVGFSDAISGARQIQMLGLAGTYTQILDENRAIMRGISAPYALSYTPGMWLNSIQVSKGISSVTAGHEAITGQINLEHRKPTDSERLFLNLYLNNELKPEVNLSTAQPVGKSGKLHTVVLMHLSADTDLVDMDHNNDGFRDLPLAQQYNIANRWSYLAANGTQLRWGVKLLEEDRLGGMTAYDTSRREYMLEDNIYGSQIQNRGVNGYFKFGTPVGKGVYDYEEREELRSNVAFMADYDYFDEDAYFGLNNYDGAESRASMNLMYNRYFTPSSSLIVGLSAQLESISEQVENRTATIDNTYNLDRTENEAGIYTEYTYKYRDHFSLIAGLRGDYNSYYQSYHLTPRGQVKWSLTPTTTLRASAGMGHRTQSVITDNIWMLATGREIIFERGTGSDFDRQERALTMGGSLTQQFKIIKAGDATISVDYFRTDFANTVVVDQEWGDSAIHIYNSANHSTTDTYQADLTWAAAKGLDLFATFRYTDSSITLDRPDGSTQSVERPLVSRYKTLLNLQYATPMRKWVLDATAQLNGSTRLTALDGELTNSEYSPAYPMFFTQISRRVAAWEIYAGCENIGNYTQPDPIISADQPFSSDFNSSVIWGSLMGRKFYIGVRLSLY